MHRSWDRPGLLVVILLSLTATAQSLSQHGVSADPTVTQMSYSAFQGLTPPQVWQALENADYWSPPRGVPAGYYDPIDLSSRAKLRGSLHARIAGHQVFKYTTPSNTPESASHKVDVWDIMVLADAHPLQPDRVLDIYQNGKFDRQFFGGSGQQHYDREHTWPKSLGFPTDNILNPAYSDCHHLMAAYWNYNTSRGNNPYGNAPEDPARRKSTVENLGRGGSFHDEPDSSNYAFSDRWQTWVGRRGDVARAMFYMDVRYDGGTNEADLQLTDDISKIKSKSVWQTGGTAHMGLLADLLQWHQQDPVDDLERRRNTVVYLFQGNRNPFIDHPEWVGPVFAGTPIVPGGTPVEPADGEDPDVPVAAGATVWINEFHYDNAGEDTDEFVEVCGPAGTDLSGWKLVAYNGSGGTAYKTIIFASSIPDEGSGFGTVAVTMAPLQNGPPDGLALINATGQVVEFISYEGQFTAADGPAAGRSSTDIGRAETGTTPVGSSLQRRGQGTTGSAFQWQGPAAASRGRVNDGQACQ